MGSDFVVFNNKIMKALELFNYDNHQVRVVGTPEVPLFVAKDVCDLLDIKQPNRALKNLDEDEKLMRLIVTSGQKRQMLCITESGLWYLIIRSRKPEAKRIRKWVTAEVLPSIRKTGSYGTEKPKPNVWYYKGQQDNFFRSIIGITNSKERLRVYDSWRDYHNGHRITIENNK